MCFVRERVIGKGFFKGFLEFCFFVIKIIYIKRIVNRKEKDISVFGFFSEVLD